MKSELIKTSQIKSNPNNPRVIKDDKFKKLVNSIKEFPKMLNIRPIVVNDDMVVLGGNMRLKACKEAGLKELPVIKASDLNEEEQRRFIIADNVGYGEWDWELIAKEWDADQLNEWGLDIPDFKPIEAEAHEDDFEVPDEIKTDIVLGDIIKIGNHTLICGSATDSNVWQNLQIESGTCCFTSPPYNAGDSAKLTGNKAMSKKGNFYESYKDNSDDYELLLQESLSNAIAFTDGVAFNVQPLANNKNKLLKWIVNNENSFVDIITWDKGHAQPAMAEGVCSSRFEWICIFNRQNNSRHIPLSSWRGTISNVYTAPPQRQNEYSGVHAATFPIHLPSFIIADLMNRSTGVVDCFMGTGTTMLAAHQLGRKSYGIELDPKYCQVIIDRMLKNDPNIEVKINDKPYFKTGE
jgi:DNA modification methylase